MTLMIKQEIKKKDRLILKREGFTLIELILAVAIILPVLLGAIGLNVYVFRATETSRRTMVALQDAHTVVERIRNTSETSLSAVTSAYPDSQAVTGFSNLPSEQITVDYANINADPLDLIVTVSWLDRGRTMVRNLSTQVTKR